MIVGHVTWWPLTLAEATKGANLSKEEAVAIAERFLREEKQIDLSAWKLVEANSDKHPNRTDHSLTWQQTVPLDSEISGANNSNDHAYVRMNVQVLGDEPADYRTYIKIPEDFQRRQGEQTVARTLVTAGQVSLGLGLVISVLVLYFKRLHVQPAVSVPWRRMFRWGLVGLAGFLLSFAFGNRITSFLAQFPTTMPLRFVYGTIAVSMILGGALMVGAITILFGLAWSFAARAFGEEQLPAWLGMPADYYRDAFWIGVAGSALMMGLRRGLDFASAWWPTLHRSSPADFGDLFDSALPGLAVSGSTILHALLVAAIISLGGAFLGAELRVRWLRLVLFFAVAAAFVFSYGSAADFLKQFLESAIVLAMVVFGICRVVRFNLLGLFLVAACSALLSAAGGLVTQPNTFYRANGYGILLVVVLLLAWPLVSWRLGGQGAQGTN
jgi:hypothetical protein